MNTAERVREENKLSLHVSFHAGSNERRKKLLANTSSRFEISKFSQFFLYFLSRTQIFCLIPKKSLILLKFFYTYLQIFKKNSILIN